jgi:Domain of unknown function (DUF3425)
VFAILSSGKRKAILQIQSDKVPAAVFGNHAKMQGARRLKHKAVEGIHSCQIPGNSQVHEVDLFHVFNSAAGLYNIGVSQRARIAAACKLSGTDMATTIRQFQNWIFANYTAGSPRVDKLLVLVKFNVFRALISNSTTLGFAPEDGMDDDAISPFCSLGRARSPKITLPSALRPTDSQYDIPHHPWIDLLPVPRMRQNLIRAGDTYDDMALCGDLVGLFSAGTGQTGMIVWGEPWDIAAWEVTEAFLKHWGWTVRGCQEIFESTNRWRLLRNERPLSFHGL